MARGKLEPIHDDNGNRYFKIDESDIDLLAGLFIKVDPDFDPEEGMLYDFVITTSQNGDRVASRIVSATERTKVKKSEHAGAH